MNKFFKISYKDSHCLADNQNQLNFIIEEEIINELEEGEVAEITIEKVTLTDEEVKEAGDFEGFN